MPITNSGQLPLFGDDGKPFNVKKEPTWQYGHRTRWGIEIPRTQSGGMDKRSKGYKTYVDERNKRQRERTAAIKAEKQAKERRENIRKNRQSGARKGWETRRTNILKQTKYNKFLFAAGAGLAATAGIGAMFSGQHASLSNPGGLFSPRTKPEDVRNSSFWTRQSSIMAAGHLDPNKTALGGMWDYNVARMADTAKTMFASPFGANGISPATAAGATIGGGMSVMAAGSIAGYKAFGQGKLKKAWNDPGKFLKGKGKKGVVGMLGIVGAGLAGALFGGYQGTKVDIGFSRALKTARKNVLMGGRRRLSNRAHTQGRGYRMWASPRGTRRMGQPGHLGMDGSMAFAMHNARHRSTLG